MLGVKKSPFNYWNVPSLLVACLVFLNGFFYITNLCSFLLKSNLVCLLLSMKLFAQEEWRIQMLPIKFLFLTAWPVVVMRIRCKSNGKDYPSDVPRHITKVLELNMVIINKHVSYLFLKLQTYFRVFFVLVFVICSVF